MRGVVTQDTNVYSKITVVIVFISKNTEWYTVKVYSLCEHTQMALVLSPCGFVPVTEHAAM